MFEWGRGGGELRVGRSTMCTVVAPRLCMVQSGNPHSCTSPDSEQRHDCDEDEVQHVA